VIAEASPEKIPENVQKAISIGADIVEIRLDYIHGIINTESTGLLSDIILQVLKICSVSHAGVVFTLRSFSEGGMVDVSEDIRFGVITEIINTLLSADFKDYYIDMEYSSLENFLVYLQEHLPSVSSVRLLRNVIISYHDFFMTPSEDAIIDSLSKMASKGGIAKAAFFCRDEKDVESIINAKQALREKGIRYIVMGMGELGKIIRKRAFADGDFMVYGSIGTETAPGQLSVSELVRLKDKRNM